MRSETPPDWFRRHLRSALISLYDPSVLGTSPLALLFGLDRKPNSVRLLRRVLIDAIEALRPENGTPVDTKTWRVYQILRRRYTEQACQSEVAASLDLSVRQLQRDERLAREVLARHLWMACGLPMSAEPPHVADLQAGVQGRSGHDQTPGTPPSRRQEVERFGEAIRPDMTDVEALIADVLSTIEPLAQAAGVTVEQLIPEPIPDVPLRADALRQALLTLLEAVIVRVPNGHAQVAVRWLRERDGHAPTTSCASLNIAIRARTASGDRQPEYAGDASLPEIVRQLVGLCGGSFHSTTALSDKDSLAVGIRLPITPQSYVLVVDDNTDTLRLFERYVLDTQYRFVGAQDAQTAISLAVRTRPQVIVLDVMMPREDGWRLLGMLREHPETHGIPIIVCTVLNQKNLALTLGASEFIRKPIGRKGLLSALDRWSGSLARGSQ